MNWEFFEIGGVKFLALAKHAAGQNHDVDSQIYQWNGTAFMNMPSMSLPTRGAQDFEFFEIDNTQYLAVANHRDGGNFNLESYIYRWNGNSFVTFQATVAPGASHWEHFAMDGVHYLALACFYDGSSHNVNSKSYRWDGAEFAEIQSIATIGALDFEFFTRSGAHYLAVANSRDGPNVNVESKLYKWDGAAFVEMQAITTNDAYDWEYFESNCFSYLVAANRGGVTEVFRVERNSSTVCLPDPASPSVEIVSDLADTDIVLNIHVPAIPASTAEGENLTWRFDIGSSMQELRVWGGSECLSWEIRQTSENSTFYQVSMPHTKLLQACSLNAENRPNSTDVNRTINSSVSPGYTLLGPGYCLHGFYDGHDATDATLEACKAKCTSEPMCQFFALAEGHTCSRYFSTAEGCGDQALRLVHWLGHISFAKETDAWLPSGYRPLGPGHCLMGYYDGWIRMPASKLVQQSAHRSLTASSFPCLGRGELAPAIWQQMRGVSAGKVLTITSGTALPNRATRCRVATSQWGLGSALKAIMLDGKMCWLHPAWEPVQPSAHPKHLASSSYGFRGKLVPGTV